MTKKKVPGQIEMCQIWKKREKKKENIHNQSVKFQKVFDAKSEVNISFVYIK